MTFEWLFGLSEFALRSLSAVAGLALVIFTYLLGRHLFGEVTGLTCGGGGLALDLQRWASEIRVDREVCAYYNYA